MDFSSLILFL